MTLTLKQVSHNHPDFLTLVDELNEFFVHEWGEAAAEYAHHHNLNAMQVVFVAYQGEIPVGCGAWKVLDDGRPEVKRMYVRKEYRKDGVAARLLAALETTIREAAYQTVVLETGAEMLPALKFYQKNGFRLIPNYGEFVGDDRCVCLEKILTN